MAFGRDIQHTVTFAFVDPTADRTFPIWRVPSGITKVEILEGWACSDTTVTLGNGTGVALTMLDYGTAGAANVGTVTAVLGGTTVTWTADTPKPFVMSDGTLDADDYLFLKYDETGTVAPANITGGFTWVSGVGA